MSLPKRSPILLLLVALGLSGYFFWIRAQDRSIDPGVLESIDSLFAEYSTPSSPGCAVIVLDRTEVEFRRGYGMASLELAVPIDSSTVFRTGSVSKQFTAAVITLLARDGVLSLDDPIRTFLPELHPVADPITLRHLLHHTSGFRDYLDLMVLAGRGSDDFYRKEQALDLLSRQEELNFPVGTRFLYSNSGYFLLSQVVKRATEKTLRTEAEERLFGPLGMERTHFHDDRDQIVRGGAGGYAPAEEGGYSLATTRLDLVGDGGVFTTIDDLGLWLASMEEGSLGEGALVRTLLTRGSLSDGTSLSYARGIGHGIHRGLPYVGHGGSFVGFRAATVRFPREHLSVGLLCNRADVDPMATALAVAELVLEDEMDPAPIPEAEAREASPGSAQIDPGPGETAEPNPPDEILGSYYSPELNVSYELRVDGGNLVAELGGIRTLPVRFLGPDIYEALFITLRIHRDEGSVTGLHAALPRASGIWFEKR